MKTTTKGTAGLKIGDVVHVHGCRMQLIEATIDTARAEFNAKAHLDLALQHARNRPGEVARAMADYDLACSLRAFRSTYLGPIHNEPGIPEGWRKDWAIQGNRFATWEVEVA